MSHEKYPPRMPKLCWCNALIGYPIFTDLASTFKSPLNHLKSLFHEMPNLALDTDRENKRTRFFFFLSLPQLIPRASHKKRHHFFIHPSQTQKVKRNLRFDFFFLKRLTYYEQLCLPLLMIFDWNFFSISIQRVQPSECALDFGALGRG